MARADDFAQNKPFTFGVEMDSGRCNFGRFLSAPETVALMSNFPAFKAAMESMETWHQRLHASTAAIQKAVSDGDLERAMVIFQTDTQAATTAIQKSFQEAIAAEEGLEKGFQEANAVYAGATVQHLGEVQRLLHALRKEIKSKALTDVALLGRAEGAKRNVAVSFWRPWS